MKIDTIIEKFEWRLGLFKIAKAIKEICEIFKVEVPDIDYFEEEPVTFKISLVLKHNNKFIDVLICDDTMEVVDCDNSSQLLFLKPVNQDLRVVYTGELMKVLMDKWNLKV